MNSPQGPNKCRILHIDDQVAILKGMEDIAKKLQIDYFGTQQWIQISEEVKKSKKDMFRVLLLCDQEMIEEVGINGSTVAKAIKRATPEIPVIIFTGNPDLAKMEKKKIRQELKGDIGVLEVLAKRERAKLETLLAAFSRNELDIFIPILFHE